MKRKIHSKMMILECRIHQRQAMPLHKLIVKTFGLLAGLCIVGGMIAIVWNAIAKTKFSMFGVTLSTGHVGVAFVGIGIVTAFFTIKAVLKNQYDLARIPPDVCQKPYRADKK